MRTPTWRLPFFQSLIIMVRSSRLQRFRMCLPITLRIWATKMPYLRECKRSSRRNRYTRTLHAILAQLVEWVRWATALIVRAHTLYPQLMQLSQMEYQAQLVNRSERQRTNLTR